jgi:hypothetical protein
MKDFIWPLLAGALFVVGIVVGKVLTETTHELKAASMTSMCYETKSWEAYVAKEGEDYVCFKQQKFNKRIIRYSIVERDIE